MSKKNKVPKQKSPMSKLMPYLKRKKASLYGSIIASSLSSVFGFVPYLVVYILSIQILHISNSFSPTNLTILVAISLGAILLKGLFFMMAVNLSHKAAYDVLYDIRIDLADKLTKLPLGYFDKNDVGSIKHTMNEDVEQLEEGIAHLIPDLTTGIVVPVVTFIVMFVLDWKMALAAFMMIPILGIAFAFANKKLGRMGPKYGEINQLLSSTLLQYVYGMKVIRAFSRTERAYEDYSKVVNQVGNMGEEVEKQTIFVKTLAAGLAQMPLLIVVPVGVWFYSIGEITLSLFIIFVMLTIGIGNTLLKAFRSSGSVSFRIASVTNKIMNLLEQAELPRPKQPKKPEGSSLEFQNVSFSYDAESEVLNNVSFTVPQGTLTALVGSSGAGKTTIARMVPRFWDVTEGSVTIGGVDVRSLSNEDMLQKVSYVSQDIYLFDGTIMDNIRMGRLDATDEEVMEAAKQAQCHDFIVNLPDGYQTVVGEGGGRLSGGQRQRISIIRAFLKQAPILILDEATALIDPENEALIQDAINELVAPVDGQPKTILMIAHRLHTVIHADQILVIEDGTVVGSGTHQQLLAENEHYRNQWEAYTVENNPPIFSDSVEDHSVQQVESHQQEVQKSKVLVNESEEEVDLFRKITEQSIIKNAFVFAGADNEKRLKKSFWLSALEGPFVSVPFILVAFIIFALYSETSASNWLLVGAITVAFVFQWITYYLSNRETFPFYQQIIANIRLYLGKRLKNLPYGFFINEDASTIEMRIKQDAMLAGYLPAVGIGLIKGLIVPVIILAVLFWIDWPLALIAIAGVPFCFLITNFAERKLQTTLNRLQIARKHANKRIVDFIKGISVIRAFGLKDSSLIGYKDAIDEYRDSSIDIQYKYSPFAALNIIMFELGFIAVVIVGGFRFMDGSINGIEWICFLVLTVALYEPLPFMDYMAHRRMAKTVTMSLNEIILEDDLKQPSVNQQVIPTGSEINFHAVQFGYQDEPVLKDFNLRIPEKGITAFVGPSGGGKTTALNLISRFWDVDAGSVTIGGVDVREMRHDTLMKQITPVFQDVYLMADTILNNLKYGRPEATMEEVIEAAKLARCHDFIMELSEGYNTFVSEGGGTLSGGQKQRMSIARAILKNAPIILLDEATASIDPENEKYIREALQVLSKNKTVVIVAHRIHTIQQADQIAVVEDGQVVQVGKHDELVREEGLYRQFWNERTRAEQWEISKLPLTSEHKGMD
ncbi:ABC transporter ATP-binding protein [Pseudogracilibacillus sp. SO30301A]|uniref:ABC transporter ATP-binding protein n=1 Tax=Pseudogracilibacillus sp. SO30301A TaxID=3098291 RepID=UPI00300E4B7D